MMMALKEHPRVLTLSLFQGKIAKPAEFYRFASRYTIIQIHIPLCVIIVILLQRIHQDHHHHCLQHDMMLCAKMCSRGGGEVEDLPKWLHLIFLRDSVNSFLTL